MKRVLPIALGLLLCHCGTEVGNGVAPEEKVTQGSTTGNGAPTSAPEAAEDSATNYILSTSFIAACASPFAETIEGTFMNSTNTTGFKVTPETDGRKTVTRLDGSTIFVITPAPTVGTYAIQALPMAPQVTCSEVKTETLADASLQRSVTLDNGTQLVWTLVGGKVISMKLTTSTAAEESWNRR
ncbi:hypothetical protein [Oligoflexus tunisiensis]|uniref:hypothetical protein n=1 Tax=Oligoflexus tunisiensis TaxID=708132 RepID=UPI00114CFDE7|nr:hypothetical protein [Oligoflexus tunisiensis]